jgi:outer membrane protein assembly factor BamB
MRISLALVTIATGGGMATALLAAGEAPQSWPQFRGTNAAGVAESARPPVKVGPSEALLWKVEVPWSPSSPAIAGERIFLTTFVDGELQTRCHSCADGSLLWSQNVKPATLEVFHRSDGSPAAATPATDGKRVVSYFGSFGLLCYDLDGKELWRHPLPVALSGGGFGSGTSPVIAGNLVLLNRDQDENSSLLAVDLETGKTVWETPRPDARGSFGTPIVWKNDGVDEVVLAGGLRIKGYDLMTGAERWKLEGIAAFVCTTPVVGDGMLYFAAWSPGKSDAPWPAWPAFLAKNDKNGDGVIALEEFDTEGRDFARGMDLDHDGKVTKEDWDILLAGNAKAQNTLVAVKPGGRGDISETHVAWKFTRGLPYVPSPLFHDGRVYFVKDGGMMSSLNASDGKAFYTQERLGAIGSYYASPVIADGRIYIASVPGKLSVVKAGGDKPEILHQVDMGERIFATPAPVGDRLYLRTEKHLWAFGK